MYVIEAGLERPKETMRGILEKGMGQSSVQDTGFYPSKRGDCGMPNRTEAWGKRIVEGVTLKEGERIDLKDARYRGKIEFLPWGDPNGVLIVCRYLRGYDTLDYQYQNLVLNADANIKDDSEASADAFFLRIPTGESSFEEKENEMYVQMLKIHEYNRDSKSKSPEAINFMFKEVNFVSDTEKANKIFDSGFDALSIVKEASNDTGFGKLKILRSIVDKNMNVVLADKELLLHLSSLAKDAPEDFMDSIENYKRNVSNDFVKAESYQGLDLTKDGIIAIGGVEGQKKTVVAEGIPAKKDGMKQWVLANFLDPKSWEVAFQLKKFTEILK